LFILFLSTGCNGKRILAFRNISCSTVVIIKERHVYRIIRAIKFLHNY